MSDADSRMSAIEGMNDRAYETRTVTHELATLRKEPERRDDGVVIRYTVDSRNDEPIKLTFEDELPSSGCSEVGFHPDYTPLSWSVEDRTIAIEDTFEPNETSQFTLGIVIEDWGVAEFEPSGSPEFRAVTRLDSTTGEQPGEDRTENSGIFQRARETLFSAEGASGDKSSDAEESPGTLELEDPTEGAVESTTDGPDGDADEPAETAGTLDLRDPNDDTDDQSETIDLADPQGESEEQSGSVDLDERDTGAESTDSDAESSDGSSDESNSHDLSDPTEEDDDADDPEVDLGSDGESTDETMSSSIPEESEESTQADEAEGDTESAEVANADRVEGREDPENDTTEEDEAGATSNADGPDATSNADEPNTTPNADGPDATSNADGLRDESSADAPSSEEIEVDAGSMAPEETHTNGHGTSTGDTAAAEQQTEDLVATLSSELREGDVSEADLEAIRETLGVNESRSEQIRREHLQARMDDFGAYAEVLEEFIDEHGTFSEFSTELDQETTAFRAEVERVHDEIEELRDIQSTIRSRVDSLDASIEGTADDIATVQDDVEAVREDVETGQQRLTDEVSEIRTQLETVTESLEDVEETTDAELAKLRAAVEEFESVHSTLENAFGAGNRVDQS